MSTPLEAGPETWWTASTKGVRWKWYSGTSLAWVITVPHTVPRCLATLHLAIQPPFCEEAQAATKAHVEGSRGLWPQTPLWPSHSLDQQAV